MSRSTGSARRWSLTSIAAGALLLPVALTLAPALLHPMALILDRVRVDIDGDVAVVTLARADKHNGVDMPMLAAVLLGGFSWICHMIYKNYSMAFVPNPSYQAAILLTAPVFIAAFYHLTKHKEEADVKSGMGIVACALLLALLTVN